MTESISAADLPEIAHPNHGRTVAAWVTNIGIVDRRPWSPPSASASRHGPSCGSDHCGGGRLIAGAVLKALGHGQPEGSLRLAGSRPSIKGDQQ